MLFTLVPRIHDRKVLAPRGTVFTLLFSPQGYAMQHTLGKWAGLDFLSHWVAMGTFVLYQLI